MKNNQDELTLKLEKIIGEAGEAVDTIQNPTLLKVALYNLIIRASRETLGFARKVTNGEEE